MAADTMEVEGDQKARKIMVALDESDESMYALSWCLSKLVSHHSDSQDALVILHVKRPPVVYAGFSHPADLLSHDVLMSLDTRDREVAQWVIQKALKLCKDSHVSVKVEERVEDGDPRDVICETVKALGADLLVMGSHGYGPITRTLLGSVSNHCVQNASCPVLVVKMPKSAA